MDDVQCQPGDEVLEDCDHNSWGNTSCSHREDVGVVCRPSEQSTNSLHESTHFLKAILLGSNGGIIIICDLL